MTISTVNLLRRSWSSAVQHTICHSLMAENISAFTVQILNQFCAGDRIRICSQIKIYSVMHSKVSIVKDQRELFPSGCCIIQVSAHHWSQVAFSKPGYPTVYWWESTMLTMNPKELKWSQSTSRLPPRRVAAMADYHTRITHRVLWWIQTINQNHLSWIPFINKTH